MAQGYLPTTDILVSKFTEQQRDSETGLDWFQVRHMSGAQGRFQSTNPRNAGAEAGDPQTWNGYAYVANNPLSIVDPSGMGFWSDLLGTASFASKLVADILTAGFGGFFSSTGAFVNIAEGASDAVWGERVPFGVGDGGTVNTGHVYSGGIRSGIGRADHPVLRVITHCGSRPDPELVLSRIRNQRIRTTISAGL